MSGIAYPVRVFPGRGRECYTNPPRECYTKSRASAIPSPRECYTKSRASAIPSPRECYTKSRAKSASAIPSPRECYTKWEVPLTLGVAFGLKALQRPILSWRSHLVDRDESPVACSDRVAVDPPADLEVVQHGFQRRLEISHSRNLGAHARH